MNARNLGTGTWISIGAPVITEMVAAMGFDWLLVDFEHGSMTEADLLPNLQAAAASGVKVIVRVGEFRPSLVGRVLDLGAAGIMVPHVSDAATAARIVSAMRYPPYGDRGFSTSTRSFGYGARVPKDMNDWEPPLLLAQIENYEGVLEAGKIAEVDGVDMLFVGPRDLGLDLSVRPSGQSMDFDEALQRVAGAAARSGKQAGILVRNIADIPRLRGYGFTALAVGSDLGTLRSGYTRLIDSVKPLKL
jgi:2-dehydro-3-deoxyglucarate aldolase/4-hydroxy-2-oxoheptanedioate aldolase